LLSMGHARALINAGSENEQLAIFERIVADNLSVRDTEVLAGEKKDKPASGKSAGKAQPLSFGQQQLRDELSSKLGTKIALKVAPKGKGQIVIPFENEADLARIAEILDLH